MWTTTLSVSEVRMHTLWRQTAAVRQKESACGGTYSITDAQMSPLRFISGMPPIIMVSAFPAMLIGARAALCARTTGMCLTWKASSPFRATIQRYPRRLGSFPIRIRILPRQESSAAGCPWKTSLPTSQALCALCQDGLSVHTNMLL